MKKLLFYCVFFSPSLFAQMSCPTGQIEVVTAGVTQINNITSYSLCLKPNSGVLYVNANAPAGFTDDFLNYAVNGSNVFRIDSSGGVHTTSMGVAQCTVINNNDPCGSLTAGVAVIPAVVSGPSSITFTTTAALAANIALLTLSLSEIASPSNIPNLSAPYVASMDFGSITITMATGPVTNPAHINFLIIPSAR